MSDNNIQPQQDSRHWSSSLMFIVGATASAVGLGNVVKFSYIVKEYEGGLFTWSYLFYVLVIGIPLLILATIYGRTTQANPAEAFYRLSGGKKLWGAAGGLAVFASGLILSFYALVGGWTLQYTIRGLTGRLTSATDMTAMFGHVASDSRMGILFMAIFLGATAYIVSQGLQGGIEKYLRILMTSMFVVLLLILAYTTQLPGFSEGLAHVFVPDHGNWGFEAQLEALGHSFFTLSLGAGIMITYGAYLHREQQVPGLGLSIGALDTVVALLSALIVFAVTASYDIAEGGIGLVFMSVPTALANLPFGDLWNTLFFGLLAVAALTSAISLLEVVVAYCSESFGMRRATATAYATGLLFVLGTACAINSGFFDFSDMLSSRVLLPLGGLLLSLLATQLDHNELRREFEIGLPRSATFRGLSKVWAFQVRYVCPVAISVIMIAGLYPIVRDAVMAALGG